jgi:hypothetical protein
MLATAKVLLVGAMILSSTLLLMGLMRPVYVLWFLDRFNRLKVLRVYGTCFGLSALLYFLLWFFE